MNSSLPVAACYCSRAVLCKNDWEQLAAAAFAKEQGSNSLGAVACMYVSLHLQAHLGTLVPITATSVIGFVRCLSFCLCVCSFVCFC